MRGRPFPPGESGNPGGRPKGATAMARMIRDETRDGAELVPPTATTLAVKAR